MNKVLRRNDLIYPELNYQIVGILLDVYDSLGYGHGERVYQKTVAVGLEKSGLKFKEQIYFPLTYNGKLVGKSYFDFLVEDKIILELKKGDRFIKAHIDQLYGYLISANLRLGLLVYFAPRRLHYKRVVNLSQ